MDSAPMSPADATTVYVSLWQTNTRRRCARSGSSTGRRVERERGEVPDGDGLAGADGRDARRRATRARTGATAELGALMRLFGLEISRASRSPADALRRRRARWAAAGCRSCANPSRAPGSRTRRPSPPPNGARLLRGLRLRHADRDRHRQAASAAGRAGRRRHLGGDDQSRPTRRCCGSRTATRRSSSSSSSGSRRSSPRAMPTS